VTCLSEFINNITENRPFNTLGLMCHHKKTCDQLVGTLCKLYTGYDKSTEDVKINLSKSWYYTFQTRFSNIYPTFIPDIIIGDDTMVRMILAERPLDFYRSIIVTNPWPDNYLKGVFKNCDVRTCSGTIAYVL
jgi:hypothetical protein